MSAPWVVIAAIIAVAVGYVLLPVVADTFRRFRTKRSFRCPVNRGRSGGRHRCRASGMDLSFRQSASAGKELLSVAGKEKLPSGLPTSSGGRGAGGNPAARPVR